MCYERFYNCVTSRGSVSVGLCFKTYISYIISTKRISLETIFATVNTVCWKRLKHFPLKLSIQMEVRNFSALRTRPRMNAAEVILLLLFRSKLYSGALAYYIDLSWLERTSFRYVRCKWTAEKDRHPASKLREVAAGEGVGEGIVWWRNARGRKQFYVMLLARSQFWEDPSLQHRSQCWILSNTAIKLRRNNREDRHVTICINFIY
jgi:hypothetical protein